MMKLKSIIIIFLLLMSTGYGIQFAYKKYVKAPQKKLFKTKKPTITNIHQIIETTGKLRVKEKINLGSLVSGTIEKLLVNESDNVKKEQILATINTGSGDTNVREAEAILFKYKAKHEYITKHYKRKKELFHAKQLSKDEFEKSLQEYLQSKTDVTLKKISLERKLLAYKNATIVAPNDGIIIAVNITEGQRVSVDLNATDLFVIAQDITKMEAKLDIDESDIGNVSVGQKVGFNVDTYPHLKFESTINSISFSTHKDRNGQQSYMAIIDVGNDKKLLRPDMTINAKITIAKADNVLAITADGFLINSEYLNKVAETLNYTFNPLSKERKEAIEQKNIGKHLKYLWVKQDKSFVEKAVILKITDDIHFEVESGIDKNDEIVTDVDEPDAMKKIYEKWFGGSF